LSTKSKVEEELRRLHKANIEELRAMLRRERETHERVLQRVRKESKKKFNVRALLHPELAYLDELREAAMYPLA